MPTTTARPRARRGAARARRMLAAVFTAVLAACGGERATAPAGADMSALRGIAVGVRLEEDTLEIGVDTLRLTVLVSNDTDEDRHFVQRLSEGTSGFAIGGLVVFAEVRDVAYRPLGYVIEVFRQGAPELVIPARSTLTFRAEVPPRRSNPFSPSDPWDLDLGRYHVRAVAGLSGASTGGPEHDTPFYMVPPCR